jgi:hypothetical protein
VDDLPENTGQVMTFPQQGPEIKKPNMKHGLCCTNKLLL